MTYSKREGHRAIVDPLGEAGHVRTVPIPDWVKGQLDEWLRAAGRPGAGSFAGLPRWGGHGETA
jgi:hypothetical protein